MDRSGSGDHLVERTENVAIEALRQGGHADLPDVLDVLYRDFGADNVLFMITNHNNPAEYWSEVTREDVLEALERNAVPYSFIEFPDDRNEMVKSFQKAAINPFIELNYKSFAERFQEGDRVPSRFVSSAYSSSDDWTLFCEDGQDCKALTLEYLEERIAPYLDMSAKHGIRTYLTDADGTWLDLYYEQKAACKGATSSAQEKQECEEAKEAYYLERHDDMGRAKYINRIAVGSRTFISGGAAHGCRTKDYEEFLNGRSVKVDVAPNLASYDKDYGVGVEKMKSTVKAFGEDPPDLVYLYETKTFVTTCATPPELVALLAEKFDVVSYEALRAEEDARVPMPEEVLDKGEGVLFISDIKAQMSSAM